MEAAPSRLMVRIMSARNHSSTCCDAAFAGGAEAVEVGAAGHRGGRAGGKSLDDVAAAPHPAVADDLDTAAHRVGDRRHEREGGGRAVELAPAVVGQRDGIDAAFGREHRIVDGLNALQDDRPVPALDRSQSTSVQDSPGSNWVLM